MNATMDRPAVATEGSKSSDSFHAVGVLETVGKEVAIACFNAAVESFCAARKLSRAQLAEDLCGMSEGNFSKIANGVQGDFLALVYKVPADIRGDFYDRLRDTEHFDPLPLAMEHLMAAMFRVMQLTGGSSLPAKARQMAQASLRERRKRSA